MTTVIDSLLVVLGLDSSGFDKGRKQTAEGFKKTRDEAEKTGGSLGEFDKKAAAGFASLKNEAIGLFLAFQGASSIKDFVGNMITGDASTPAAGDTGGGGGRGGAGGGASGGLLHDVPSAKGVLRTELMHAGMTAEQAAGIVAGIEAEGGGLGQSANGAFGIGQWRGKRKDALLAKYGKAPSLSQQVDFLVRELRGGDPGGRAVTGQQSAAATMVAYLSKFMRPQGADNEHYKDLIADIQRGYRALGQAAPAGIGGRSSTVSIGSIHLPGVKDADGFARQLPDAIRRRSMTTQADRGLD